MKKITCLAKQVWSSSKVARTPPIALEYSDGGTTTPSNTALTRVGESMTRLLRQHVPLENG
ncbi:hypothetical protein C1H46_008575 [Malus baccata]|uniref:Uncharacterized protein n=1 Tax=Malus baccata TaxID=106549 RepID=A0A540N4B2_MALBA|nr:hypothetical protein C1H46_008575 [Malus baccata]